MTDEEWLAYLDRSARFRARTAHLRPCDRGRLGQLICSNSEFMYKNVDPGHIQLLLPEYRLILYRELIAAGVFADLREVIAHQRWRLQQETAVWRGGYRERQDKKDFRRWQRICKQIPPGPCAYCGAPDARTVDHVIPRARGGTHFDLSNLVRACRRCNSAKGKRTVDEWKASRLARGLPWPPVWAVAAW